MGAPAGREDFAVTHCDSDRELHHKLKVEKGFYLPPLFFVICSFPDTKLHFSCKKVLSIFSKYEYLFACLLALIMLHSWNTFKKFCGRLQN